MSMIYVGPVWEGGGRRDLVEDLSVIQSTGSMYLKIHDKEFEF